MTATVLHLPTPVAVHHTLTGADLDKVCAAAGLDPWQATRGDHEILDTFAPGRALRGIGHLTARPRRDDEKRVPALAVSVRCERYPRSGLDETQVGHLLDALAAVAPALHRDVVEGGLTWRDTYAGVLYLLGIEVTA